MIFLLSGEGAADFGVCKVTTDAEVYAASEFHHGPIAVLADRIVHERLNYSFLEAEGCLFVPEGCLNGRSKALGPVKLPGVKRGPETAYYFKNARALAKLAHELAAARETEVVAMLFRDADGTASAGRGMWAEKVQSMQMGFEHEGLKNGIPVVPKPKSEAWILCGLRPSTREANAKLEERSGNDASPNSLKAESEKLLGETPTRERLVDLVSDGTIDHRKIDLPSFEEFRRALRHAIGTPEESA